MTTAELIQANNRFYRAIRCGDYVAMDGLWARERPVTCTHPRSVQLIGRSAVIDSWRRLLAEQMPPDIWPVDELPIITGSAAVIICRERVGNVHLSASNAFVHERGAWRLINHQAYLVPEEQKVRRG